MPTANTTQRPLVALDPRTAAILDDMALRIRTGDPAIMQTAVAQVALAQAGRDPVYPSHVVSALTGAWAADLLRGAK